MPQNPSSMTSFSQLTSATIINLTPRCFFQLTPASSTAPHTNHITFLAPKPYQQRPQSPIWQARHFTLTLSSLLRSSLLEPPRLVASIPPREKGGKGWRGGGEQRKSAYLPIYPSTSHHFFSCLSVFALFRGHRYSIFLFLFLSFFLSFLLRLHCRARTQYIHIPP